MASMHCIINPAGRDGSTGKRWPKILERLKEDGWNVETHLTERVGHATEIAYELRNRFENEDQKPLVVAVGGDGTAHEVASGLRGSSLVLGLIPTGSGNDLAMAHGLHRKKMDLTYQTLLNGVDRSVGALRLEGKAAPDAPGYPAIKMRKCDGPVEVEGNVVRWVFLESDCGVTSLTSRAKLTRGKWIRGSMKYTYLGITEVLKWKKRQAWIKVDNEEPKRGVLSMVAFTMCETFGGGYKVSPKASPQAKHGHLTVALNLSKLQMVRLMGPLRKGKHVNIWDISHGPAKRLEIRAVDGDGNPTNLPHSPPLFVQSDGEPCIQTPAILQFMPDQLLVRGALKVDWA